ncbi:hypothetical protein [uncultured Aquimarina sp.]|uniref:hypothetical protein n=1 Tax=uncultured Aquimarina sp. TaxID=575652 RepID=UPI00262EB1A8|nr:hypothetical protein [uncultured Aquimarina sp.]
MEKHNFAAYKAGTFSIDISNLEVGDKFFKPKDMPAFMHEYCHYIQDITTISSIFGFSLWLRDVVALTQVFSNGEGGTMSIPLERDEYGETINKHRKFYNLYSGNPKDVFDIDYSKTKFLNRHFKVNDIDLDGNTYKLGINEVEIAGRHNKLFFGLIVLQEIQAFYAQQLAEKKLEGEFFSIYSKNLPTYPYKFGDFLFEEFQIQMDLETKFILIDLCLDTVQATSVFFEVLEKLKGQTISYWGEDKADLITIVEECRLLCSHSNDVALEHILPDLEMWSKDPSRKYLSEAIEWYVNQLKLTIGLKKITSKTFFSLPFAMSWENFAVFYALYAPPIFIKNGVFYRSFSESEQWQEKEFIKNFEAASTIWSHRILYDLLCSENIEQIKKNCKCPLYDSCPARSKIGEDYICKTTPWEIIKGKNKAECQYGMAVHSFGLWQNDLKIEIK